MKSISIIIALSLFKMGWTETLYVAMNNGAVHSVDLQKGEVVSSIGESGPDSLNWDPCGGDRFAVRRRCLVSPRVF